MSNFNGNYQINPSFYKEALDALKAAQANHAYFCYLTSMFPNSKITDTQHEQVTEAIIEHATSILVGAHIEAITAQSNGLIVNIGLVNTDIHLKLILPGGSDATVDVRQVSQVNPITPYQSSLLYSK
jgi:hypothetical protein